MLSDRARQTVHEASANKRITLIVTVLGHTDAAIIADRKRQIREAVARHDPDGVRVVNELVGTPNMIVSALAKVWRRAIGNHPEVFASPSIEISANEQDFGTL